jgi:homogentisate 1,2-dioxygenase
VVIRASPASRVGAAEDIAEAARLSGEVYVVERGDGFREVLYGVSVHARRPGADPDVLQRFTAAPAYLAAPVGRLRAAGFPVLPTGAHPDHFDVQLVAGQGEADPVTDEAIMAAAWRLVGAAGDLQPNPFYAGAGDESPEDS